MHSANTMTKYIPHIHTHTYIIVQHHTHIQPTNTDDMVQFHMHT